jgi:predicted transcriptional regulator of viral defense system
MEVKHQQQLSSSEVQETEVTLQEFTDLASSMTHTGHMERISS